MSKPLSWRSFALPPSERNVPAPDPMREIDLLLTEDIMMRRNFPTDARAKVAQTLCMLVVLAARKPAAR